VPTPLQLLVRETMFDEGPVGTMDLATAIKTNRTWFDLKAVAGAEIEGPLLEAEREGFARRSGDSLELLRGGRVALVLAAMNMGISSEQAVQCLGPREFEDLVSRLLQAHSFKVMTRVRVRNRSGWAEFDVVGWRKPRAVFPDCKRWPRRAVYGAPCRSQRERVQAWGLTALRKMGAEGRAAKAFPVVTTVIPGVERVVEGCLLVGFDKLNSAISKVTDGFFDQDSLRFEL